MVDLEKLYSTHELPEDISSKLLDSEMLSINMENGLEGIYKIEGSSYRQLLFNHFLQKLYSTVDYIFPVRLEALRRDEECLESTISLVDDITGMVEELKGVITEDNYLEVARLFDFIINQFTGNLMLINSKREAIHYSKKGITFIDNRYDDTRCELKEFFDKHLGKFQKEKTLKKEMK